MSKLPKLIMQVFLQEVLKHDIQDVDFATVWGLVHVEAEITGTPTQNFIDWVKDYVNQL